MDILKSEPKKSKIINKNGLDIKNINETIRRGDPRKNRKLANSIRTATYDRNRTMENDINKRNR